MANQVHLKILIQGVEFWNQCRKNTPDVIPDLSNSDLSNSNLSNSNLSNSNLDSAKLDSAKLDSANLYKANLYRANLVRVSFSFTNLYKANLYKANLSKANLYNANLSNANLSNAILLNANLSNTNLSNTNLSNAILLNADFRTAQELTQVQLEGDNPPLICDSLLPEGMEIARNRDCRAPRLIACVQKEEAETLERTSNSLTKINSRFEQQLLSDGSPYKMMERLFR